MSGLRQRRTGANLVMRSAGLASVIDSMKSFDAYAKPMEDYRIKTFSGGAVTIIAAIIIAYLVIAEFADYATIQYLPSLRVDPSTKDKMEIFLNITFPSIPCYVLSVDVMDVSGEHLHDVDHNIWKVRLDEKGERVDEEKGIVGQSKHSREINKINEMEKQAPRNDNSSNTAKNGECGSCYGGEVPSSGCCNTCEEVRKAYAAKQWTPPDPSTVAQCLKEHYVEKMEAQRREGCQVYGSLDVNRVPGNVHIAPGASFQQMHMHVHDLTPYITNDNFLFSHSIHEFRFGTMYQGMKGVQNPLDGHTRIVKDRYLMFQYYIKVVSTKMRYLNGTVYHSNQYSVTEHTRDITPRPGSGTSGLPGVFLNFDISPMQVIYTEFKKPLSHFLTDICAIVGGIFTVAGLVDTFVYTTERVVKSKVEMGKSN